MPLHFLSTLYMQATVALYTSGSIGSFEGESVTSTVGITAATFVHTSSSIQRLNLSKFLLNIVRHRHIV